MLTVKQSQHIELNELPPYGRDFPLSSFPRLASRPCHLDTPSHSLPRPTFTFEPTTAPVPRRLVPRGCASRDGFRYGTKATPQDTGARVGELAAPRPDDADPDADDDGAVVDASDLQPEAVLDRSRPTSQPGEGHAAPSTSSARLLVLLVLFTLPVLGRGAREASVSAAGSRSCRCRDILCRKAPVCQRRG